MIILSLYFVLEMRSIYEFIYPVKYFLYYESIAKYLRRIKNRPIRKWNRLINIPTTLVRNSKKIIIKTIN